MKRLTVLATAVVALILAAACSDRVTQPAIQPEATDAQLWRFRPPTAQQIAFACAVFAARVADKHDLSSDDERRIREACIRVGGRLVALLPGGLTRDEICGVIRGDTEFDALAERYRNAISAYCDQNG
jgi:hypothetical protein